MADYTVTKVLDFKGLPCPMPVVKISQEIKSVAVGQVVEVHTTDPGSLSDFPAWAKTSGNEVVGTEQGGGLIKIFVKRLK
ncbi:MAG: sulfurtransferase TusA family protein [Myxococcales bacterium]|nr:sulfurtransferase TusA family protein [Myxococcales bacterium]